MGSEEWILVICSSCISLATWAAYVGAFDVVHGVLVGKPQDEAYYEAYKNILTKVIDNEKLPVVYNVNFGHATPRCVLQYGAMAKADMRQKKIYQDQSWM